MRALGYVTVIEMVAVGCVLGVLAIKALPDARRYIEMRKMLRGLSGLTLRLHEPQDERSESKWPDVQGNVRPLPITSSSMNPGTHR